MRNHVKTILVWFSAVLVLVAGTVVGTNFVTAGTAPGAGSVAVTFNYNGATGGNTSLNETVTSGTEADDVLPHPTKPGVSFSGWFNTQSLLNGQRITTIEDSDAGALMAGYVPPELAQTLNLVLPPVPCAQGGACDVGDPGPGGGTVFYVDTARASGSQFWEVGSDLGTAEWGCTLLPIAGTGVAIGDGETNTAKITTGCVEAVIAARVASAPAGGYSDWFLPSRDELNQLCKFARKQSTSVADQTVVCNNTRELRAGFTNGGYWTSSQYDPSGGVWAQYFNDGNYSIDSKDFTLGVRPIRAF